MENGKERKWKHEQMSIAMLRSLMDRNRINLADYGLGPDDQRFIEVRGLLCISCTSPDFDCSRSMITMPQSLLLPAG